VNAHIHLSLDAAERAEQVRHMAYYGAGTVVSMGSDQGTAPFDLRENPVADGARTLIAGRGITSPEPGRSEVPFWVTTEADARAAVQELAGQNVDLVKIWVDDRNGQYERLSQPLYTAVIDEAHQHGLKVAAHIFSLEDAKGLLRAGVDMFAHGIRDQDIDDELMALLAERPNVVLIPNLPGPGVAADLSWISTVPAAELAEMQARETDRPAAQASFGIQARNLSRLNEAGMHIAFGTDGSTPWAVHLELEDMVRTGMTPAEVITAATGSAAQAFGLTDVGVVAPAKWPTSSCSMRIRCRTSPAPGRSRTCTCAEKRSTALRWRRASAGRPEATSAGLNGYFVVGIRPRTLHRLDARSTNASTPSGREQRIRNPRDLLGLLPRPLEPPELTPEGLALLFLVERHLERELDGVRHLVQVSDSWWKYSPAETRPGSARGRRAARSRRRHPAPPLSSHPRSSMPGRSGRPSAAPRRPRTTPCASLSHLDAEAGRVVAERMRVPSRSGRFSAMTRPSSGRSLTLVRPFSQTFQALPLCANTLPPTIPRAEPPTTIPPNAIAAPAP
jgi:hypothetical protein